MDGEIMLEIAIKEIENGRTKKNSAVTILTKWIDAPQRTNITQATVFNISVIL